MKNPVRTLTTFYILFPLIILPLLQSGFTLSIFGKWGYLIGIVLYYLSVLLVAFKQKIIFMIPVLFFCWFWYTYGFDLHGFTFFLFTCMLFGAAFYQLALNVKYFVHRVFSENKEAHEYELKIEKMYVKLNLYKQSNPTVAITPEIIDGIRNEVFFA